MISGQFTGIIGQFTGKTGPFRVVSGSAGIKFYSSQIFSGNFYSSRFSLEIHFSNVVLAVDADYLSDICKHQGASPLSMCPGMELQQTRKQHLAKEAKEGSKQTTRAEAGIAICEAQKL